jgi:hypothetical protein
MLIGIIFVITAIWPSSLPNWLIRVAGMSSLCMHLWIIGWMSLHNDGMKKRNFISWNAMCASLSIAITSPLLHIIQHQHVEDATAFSMPSWHWLHTLALCWFGMLPVSMFWRRCPDACLSHTYFAPGYYGWSLVLIPSNVAALAVPLTIGGRTLSTWNNQSDIVNEAIQIIGSQQLEDALRQCNSNNKIISSDDNREDDGDVVSLLESYTAIDGSWVDLEHQHWSSAHRRHDHWSHGYLAGRDTFWQCLVNQRFGCSVIHLNLEQFGDISTVTVLQPQR